MEEYKNTFTEESETDICSADDGWFGSESISLDSDGIQVDIDHDDTDLELAAKYGNALLTKNTKLRNKVEAQKIEIEGKDMEMEHLKKKLIALQNMHESRLELLDQIEVSTQELESENLRLKNSNNDFQLKIKDLTGDIHRLEVNCENLEEELQETRNREHEYLESKRKERDEILKDSSMFCQQLTAIIEQYKKKIQTLEVKLKMSEETLRIEIRERKEAEEHVDQLIQENNQLSKNISELEEWRENIDCSSSCRYEKNSDKNNCEKKPTKRKLFKNPSETKSLLSELDDQYRVLIEHYHGMIKENEKRNVAEVERKQECSCQRKSEIQEKPETETGTPTPEATPDSKDMIKDLPMSQKKRLHQRQRKKLEKEVKSPILMEQIENNNLNSPTLSNKQKQKRKPSSTPCVSTPLISTSPQAKVKVSISCHMAQLRSFERSFADVLKFNI